MNELREMGLISQWTRALDRAMVERIKVSRSWLDGSVECFAVNSSDLRKSYTVRVLANHNGVYVACNCQAGVNDKDCKHTASVLAYIGILERPSKPIADNPLLRK